MPYRITCPACKTAYRIPDHYLGKQFQCAKCQQKFAFGKAPATPPVEQTTAKRKQQKPGAGAPPRRKKTPFVLAGLVMAILFVIGIAIGIASADYFFPKPHAEAAAIKAESLPPAAPAPLPAASEKPAHSPEKLPADLELVPGDGVAFISVKVAETWKNPALAPLRKQLEADKNLAGLLRALKQAAGLELGDIERGVVVFWGKQRTAYSVGLITTVKPYNRQRLLGTVADGQREEKVGEKTVIDSPKSPFAFHLIDERAFLYGRVADVKKLLERPAGPTRKAAWNDVLRSSLEHTLQIGVQHELFAEDPKKDTPPPLKVLNPLLDAHTAVATLDAGKELRLTLRLAFDGDEKTKQAERAARQGLEMTATFLAQFAESFKKQAPGALPPPLNKLMPGIKDAEAAVKKATIQTKGHVLTCDLALQSANWPEALAAGVALLFATENKSAPSRNPQEPPTNTEHDSRQRDPDR